MTKPRTEVSGPHPRRLLYKQGQRQGRFHPRAAGFRFRKPLAQRILESECRRCGKRGHWKAECPLRSSEHGASSRPDGSLPVAFTMSGMPYSTDLLESLPEGTQLFQDSFCWCFVLKPVKVGQTLRPRPL